MKFSNPDFQAAAEEGEHKALTEIAAMKPPARVFVIYYPPGASSEAQTGN